jgi:hypothetical protein
MTIELSAQLETALAHEAARRGTTPQELAVQLIETQLPAQIPDERRTADKTMRDRWQEHFDSLPPTSTQPRPEWLRSDNVSEAVLNILEQRRREGRL